MTKPSDDFLKGAVELRIGDHRASLQTSLPRGDVPFRAVFPLARQMTEAVISWAVEDTRTKGKKITCAAGCGACCRQPVPIGHAEARRLCEFVASLPEQRRTVVRQRFADALAQLKTTGLLQRFEELRSVDRADRRPDHFADFVRQYMNLSVACPFLENESCSIYPERPLICREYLVTSPVSECANPTAENIQRVPLKARVSMAARTLGKEEEPGDAMLLTSVLEWAASRPDEADRRPALEWVRGLQQQLGRKSESDSEPAAALGI